MGLEMCIRDRNVEVVTPHSGPTLAIIGLPDARGRGHQPTKADTGGGGSPEEGTSRTDEDKRVLRRTVSNGCGHCDRATSQVVTGERGNRYPVGTALSMF